MSTYRRLTMRHLIAAGAGATAASILLAGCNLNPAAPAVPPRPAIPAGQMYAPFSGYLSAHPQPARRGLTYGILVQSYSSGYVCLSGYCHTWHGTVVVPGDRIEHLASDQGDDGMAQLASPGDLIRFPAGGPVDAAADDGSGPPATVIVAGAVSIP